MSLPARLHRYTYADYVALEAHSTVRHEFALGEIYAMAGGTPEHAALAASVLYFIQRELPAECRAYTSDLRVRISAADLTTYPDATIVCGKSERASEDPLAVTNPTILVEVTSESTEDYDRAVKVAQYQTLPSVRSILLVSHRERRIDVVTRGNDGWSTAVYREGQLVRIEAQELSVDAIYGRATEAP